MVESDPNQANQMQILGALAAIINADAIRAAIGDAAADLRRRFLELTVGRDLPVEVQDRINVMMFSSLIGGTGGGMVLDIGAIAHDQLVRDNHRFSLSLTATTPDVHERVLRGMPEEFERCKANYYSSMTQINAANCGDLHRNGIKLGGTRTSAFVCPPSLFSKIYIVQRKDANGRDYVTKEAVADAIAANVAFAIGTRVGATLTMAEANGMVGQGLANCPISNAPRNLSTLAASMLGFSKSQLLKYSVSRQIAELQKHVLGENAEATEHQTVVEVFVDDAKLVEDVARNKGQVTQQLRDASGANPLMWIRGLYRAINGSVKKYHSDSAFSDKLRGTREAFHSRYLVSLDESVEDKKAELITALKIQVAAWMNQMISEHGLKFAGDVCELLKSMTLDSATGLLEASEEHVQRHNQLGKTANDLAATLSKYWFRSWRTHAPIHDRVAAYQRSAMTEAIESKIKFTAASVLKSVSNEASRKLHEIESAAKTARETRTLMKERYSAIADSINVTAEFAVEIDVSTTGFYRSFYSSHRIENDELVRVLSKRLECSAATLALSLATPAARSQMKKVVVDHYSRRIRSLHIGTVLDYVARKEADGRNRLKQMLNAMIRECTPMMQAELPQLGMHFTDTIVLGLPAAISPESQVILKHMVDQAISEAVPNAVYRAEVTVVETQLTDRIVCLRRSHGARANYLVAHDVYRRAYQRWHEEGQHPIDLFNERIRAHFSSLEPMEQGNDGKLAFAIAMAFGWIARRGDYYYDNLEVSGHNGSSVMTCRLRSDSDSLVYQDRNLVIAGAVKAMVDQGKVAYENSEGVDDDFKLAHGRSAALAEFENRQVDIEEVMETFDLMRTISGDANVVNELRRYAGDLKKSNKPNSTNYHQVAEEVRLIQQKADTIELG